MSINTNKH